MLEVGSEDEGTKICSGMVDDERVNEGNCKGSFKDWVSAIVDRCMGCKTGLPWREAGVVVKM